MPFEITAFADEEPATGSDIHAILYYIDPDKKTNGVTNITKNLELVFQKGGAEDPNKVVFKHFTNFADDSGKPAGYRNPWWRENYVANTGTTYATEIMKVDVKDKIAPKNMAGWFWNMNNLTIENINHLENIDTSDCTTIFYLFCGCRALTTIDTAPWNWSFPKLTNAGNVFNGCRALTSVDVSSWNMPVNDYIPGMFANCTSLETIDISDFRIGKPRIIGSLFSGCTKLKSVKLPDLTTTGEAQLCFMFKDCPSLEEVDLSGWNVQKPGTMMEMFSGCTSLTRIDFGPSEHWGNTPVNWTYNGYKERAYELMFNNCSSLESLDLTCVKGALICGSMFKGCTSLKEVNLEYAGKGRENRTGYDSKIPAEPDLTGKDNIFEDCNELAWIKLSAEGWPASGLAGTSVPPKAAWRKIDEPNKGLKLSSDELFQNFLAGYAGTWVADSFISLKGNGGTPNIQTIEGNKDVELSFNENEIVATRNGYDFDGWWTEKSGGTQVHSGDIASQWVYYAHWIEHRYTLVLDGNGGTVPDGYSVAGGTISEDRKTITFSNLNYSQFLELSKQMFFKNEDSVLASWNTRKNGKGTSYYANDSVNKLAEADGATAILYAQWHEPEAVIKFDSNGGSEVDKKGYSVGDTYGSLAEPYRAGYTFTGWYTAPNELGEETEITAESVVIGSQTLYAKWQKNPVITFNANGGRINGETETTKVCSYGYRIGTLPVPNNGSATLKGWYTAASVGTKIESTTVAVSDATYYAQWGWQPKFETNGGSFTSYPYGGYEITDSPNYTINTLPAVEKDYSTFDGWYFGNTQVHEGDTIDLSSANVITARWIDTPERTVTLKYNDNATSDTTIKVYHGNCVGQLPSPKRSGYSFEGWYDSNDVKYTYNNPAVNSDVTLTAKWTQQNRTVTFDPCGGTMVDSNTMTVVDGKTLPSLPGANYLNNKGEIQYRFGGWYTEENGGGALLTTSTPITEDRTYYAKWVDLKTQSDDYYVHSIHWATISNTEVTNTGGHLVFHPTVKGNINARLYISLEKPNGGTLDLPANTLRITIPAKLFDSDSENNNLSVFFNASDSDDLKAKYSDDGKSIILYNPSPINKNTILTPEFNVSPLALKGGYIDDNGYYQGDYFTKTFDVTIDIDAVTSGDTTIPAEHYERQLGLEVHTDADTTVSKARADVSLNWNTSEWGDAPADANEYFYVVWSLTSTNSNCNQPYKLKWSEDTIHDGSVVYASPALGEWSSAYTSDGTHTTKVVTKHRRADVHNNGDEWASVKNEAILSVMWNDEYEQQFRASRTAEVYVPMESSGSFTFAKNIPDYSNQNKHSINGGQELILNGEPELMPLPYEIGYLENLNTDNPTWNADAGTYKTKPRTIVFEDGRQGDVMLSTDYGTSSRTWDSQYIKPLNQSDYYFTELDITLDEYDAVYLDGKWSNPFVNTDVSNYGAVTVYAKTAGSGSLEVVKTLRGINSATVTLPANTVYFKVEHTSDYFTTRMNVNPTLYLTDSNRVRELISDDVADKRETIVMNKCAVSTTRENGETVVTESSKDGAWRSMYLLNISSSTLYAAKSCSSQGKVTEESSTEEFPVVIGGWNYNNSSRGYKKYMKSGVFNDLLPKDCTVDKSSVFVCPRTTNTTKFEPNTSVKNWADYYDDSTGLINTKLAAGYYSVTFKDNWENSGRTMMTVTVNSPEGEKYTGFDVFYKMKTTYSNINIYGTNLINSVSFTDTTNGQSQPDARVGLKSVLDAKSSAFYSSLESPQTAYATAKTNLKQPPKFQYGADATVRAEGSVYSKHEVVGLNTDYNYNVTYTGGDTSKTAGIIIYDVIEKYIDGPSSEWHGSFKSVDLSAVKSLESADGNGYCNPVVYYSTKAKDEFTDEDLDISKSDIWTTVKPDDDKITAIAVDCRSTTEGSDQSFVLDTKKSIGFNINMHSPASEARSELETYNEAVIEGRIVDLNVEIESRARTGVTLRFANPKFVKTAFPESGTEEKPESVVKGSVLEYVLKITNPDAELEMNDIVLEDVFSNTMKFNNTIKVQLGDGENIPINQAARISSYSISDAGQNTVFTATISTLAPGETLAITLPVTVTDDIGTPIDNTARVKSVNGVEYNIESNETHHIVSDCKVKVLKVNGQGKPLAGAVLQILDENKNVVNLTNDGVNYCTQFTSTLEVIRFNLNPGTYYVHEVSAPDNFTKSGDIKFAIDDEGIITVGNEEVSYVSVTDAPKYKVIFHDGRTDGTDAEFSNKFRTYEPNDLNADKSITHFYDIPEWAGDEYVFAGWYHNSGYTEIDKTKLNDASFASVFENDTYTYRESDGDPDYHLYAKWIKVGKIDKVDEDTNIVENNQYRGFGLAGVQFREPKMKDSNYNNNVTPGGMRFITSLSEDLLRQIDEVSDKQVLTEENKLVNVEYGYVAATKANIDAFTNHYGAVPSEYSLQYKGENVNGVDTRGLTLKERNVKTDFRYISNINCTSSHAINGKPNGQPYVTDDHRNYEDHYRLFTLVITNDGTSSSKKGESVDARAYIRYYDANGKLRVFYNNYNGTQYYGGCMCSYNQVSSMAVPSQKAEN